MNGKGVYIELGSGAGFAKEIIPSIITSDVDKGEGIDKVFSATKIPFKNKSVSAFIMLDVFHHIRNPEKALQEMSRCLKKDGKIVMLEPNNSLWGRFIYKNFHHEDFNPNSDWNIKKTGRMTVANGAIPWIVFIRDRKIFNNKFKDLKVIKIEPHTPFLYLLSGGLSKPQVVPGSFYSFFKFLEKTLSPINNWIGMFVTIEVKKL